MERGSSLARQHRLIRLLNVRREVHVAEAAVELGTSERTVYRDLRVLERVGVPIYPERTGDKTRWRVVEGYRHGLAISLSWAEMVAVAAGRALLGGLGDSFFADSAGTALEKIRDALPKEVAQRSLDIL